MPVMTSFMVVKRVKLFEYDNIIEWFCEINMLNYLFHLMFWPDKDLETFNNIAVFKQFYSLNYYMTSLWVRSIS